ncbi:MAG TPA: cytochrome c biogenesis protein CcdA [Bacteroidales bacterium]|nr:cytochrome c biogenesis protein CcdA [Bacteroidales bacterium]
MNLNRKIRIFIFLLFIFSTAGAQILEPVKWSVASKKTGDASAEITLTATIDKGWHLYSQDIPANGPVPTEFVFEKNKFYSLEGKVVEPKPITEKDPNFDNMLLKYFSTKAIFKQKINILHEEDFMVKGTVSFMCCNDVSCLPPNDVPFSVKVQGAANVLQKDTVRPDTVIVTTPDTLNTISADSVNKGTLEGGSTGASNKGLWGLFFFAFLAGLAAIITPCVFPMIPMTVSFFMHEGERRAKSIIKALFFGLSIILIYTVIGTIVAVTLGVNFANFLSTHWIPNVLFFLIFLVFAASFFGMFEITMPGWMINKSDKQADKGGIIGSFFMAFTLVLVSFSCTGPLVGAILVKSASGQVLEPIIGMLGFSIAFALPFSLFAFFPSWLSRLPKSGGWLNSVKVVLGFIELALGLKFLSIADQTYHWRILDREVYLALWIIIFTLMGFYLLGKIKFKHDSDLKYVGVFRLCLAIITFSFVIYMIPGMFGAPLKMLSGYIPPQQSLDFDISRIVREDSGKDKELCEKSKYSEFLHLPHGLNGYYDFGQGIACAREQNKPVFIDFTGHGCVNCREMEANVWSDPRVLKILREDYLIITLYVDDKKEMEESDWVTSRYDGQLKKTIGKKYADFQVYFFNVNAQPYYVLLDPYVDLKDKTDVAKAELVPPRAYDLNPDNFVSFLQQGLEEFKKRRSDK